MSVNGSSLGCETSTQLSEQRLRRSPRISSSPSTFTLDNESPSLVVASSKKSKPSPESLLGDSSGSNLKLSVLELTKDSSASTAEKVKFCNTPPLTTAARWDALSDGLLSKRRGFALTDNSQP
jgi:hypothetical protein